MMVYIYEFHCIIFNPIKYYIRIYVDTINTF